MKRIQNLTIHGTFKNMENMEDYPIENFGKEMKEDIFQMVVLENMF